MPHLSAISNRIRRRPVSSFHGGTTVGGDAFVPLAYLDTDGTLAANSDSKVATQAAAKTYVDSGIDMTPTADVNIPAHHSVVVNRRYAVASGKKLTLASGAILRIL